MRQTVYGVADEGTLEAIARELRKDREVTRFASGASRPLLLEPDIAMDEDLLRPDAAVDRLLDGAKPSSCVRS